MHRRLCTDLAVRGRIRSAMAYKAKRSMIFVGLFSIVRSWTKSLLSLDTSRHEIQRLSVFHVLGSSRTGFVVTYTWDCSYIQATVNDNKGPQYQGTRYIAVVAAKPISVLAFSAVLIALLGMKSMSSFRTETS